MQLTGNAKQRPIIGGVSKPVRFMACALFTVLLTMPSQAALADHPKVEQYSKVAAAEKINVNLLRLEHEVRTKRLSLTAAADNAITITDGGMLLDIITDDLDAGVRQKFQRPGVIVRHISEQYRRVSLTVNDPALIFELAKIPEVRMISPGYGARTRVGAADSRANEALRADIAKANFTVDGRGQIVGILSDSFAHTSSVRDAGTLPAAGVAGTLTGAKNQDTGDLPPTISILRDDVSGSDEGAAMAELVHDVAPGAALAFHTAAGGQAVFADGITALRTTGDATVIVDDILYPNEPVYQDGIVSQAAADSVAAGVPFFSAAGNDANRAYRQLYVDVNPAMDDTAIPPTGNDLHNFGLGNGGFLELILQPGASFTAALQWNQPFASVSPGKGAEIDLDLYVIQTPDAAGLATPLSSSDAIQGTTGMPEGDAVEIVGGSNTGSAPLTVYVAIDHFDGSQGMIPQDAATALEFSLIFFVRGGGVAIEGITDGSSAFGGPTQFAHSQAVGVTSVAAVPWFDTAAFDPNFGPSAQTDPESFTSRGGSLTVQFDKDGNFAPRNSFEPDITSVDANNTTFFGQDINLGGQFGEPDGFPNFFGTSAAAPNAAAVAALMLELDNNLSPTQLNAILENTAVDIVGFRAAVGDDDVTGPGLIDAAAALAAVGNLPAANAGANQRANPGAMVTLDGTGSSDSGGNITSFAWSQTAGNTVTLNGAATASPSFTAPAMPGTLTFRLTVTDNDGNTDSTSVNVVVNAPPVAKAGANQTVNTNAIVTLDGTGSSDLDGTVAGFAWTQIIGDSVVLNNTSTANPSFTAPGTAQTLSFQLIVTDNEGVPSPADTVDVVVQPTAGGGMPRRSGGGGGCLLNPYGGFDPVLPMLLLLSGLYLNRRHYRRAKQALINQGLLGIGRYRSKLERLRIRAWEKANTLLCGFRL